MNQSFQTPSIRRLLLQIQLFLALVGLMMLLIGGLRVSLELVSGVKSVIGEFAPAINNTQTLIIAGLMALAGYGTVYTLMIIGAREPYSIRALRNALLAIVVVWWAAVIWAGFTDWRYFIVTLLLSLVISGAAFWLWQQTQQQNLWQVFGESIHRRRRSRRILYVTALIGIIIMLALGIIYGILSDTLELPLSKPEAGELLYSTTFDGFNDEWNLPQGRQQAVISEGELVLTEASGISERGFYSLLEDRKFGDFDLRVRTRQIAGSNDNTFGVVFRWRDTDNYYLFEISGDGFYRLTKVEEGIAESITPVGWIPAPFIHIGETENEVRIVAKENEITFFVNQQPIRLCTKGENRQAVYNPLTEECQSSEWQMSYQDSSFSQGYIGLAVGTTRNTDLSEPVVIGFDNLVIVGPE